MLFQGNVFTLTRLDNGFAELKFDLVGESVNKFNLLAMAELEQVLDILDASRDLKGLIVASAKPAFVVGADIAEFKPVFAKGEQAIKDHLTKNNACFSRLEDLPFPTVVEVDGYALGGGFEFCLACDFRLATRHARVGLPETRLGIIPGWGGTVRLPRVAGLDVAVEWIAGGKEHSAEEALKAGVVDGVVSPLLLREASVNVLNQACAGKLDFKKRKAVKKGPFPMNDMESLMAFGSSELFVKAQSGRNYPAPVTAVKTMQAHAKCGRDDALSIETCAFAELAQGSVTTALVGLFLNDQYVAKKAKALALSAASPITRAAVIGAGIMGGGIAYQSAYTGTPVLMKDVAQQGLDLGIKEATKLLVSQVARGKLTAETMAEKLTRITPTLTYQEFGCVDLAVEAVVENAKVKQEVLAEAEQVLRPDAVLCSNTSTISISRLAQVLRRPENFCGMHFFNPVHRMPLVEVIRGEKTSDQTIARTVAYATALGKKAIVVNDCPGFLVNRVLFPYFAAFSLLIRDGADFQQIDKVMERWGWPMGPAYLADVVGIDTCAHADAVMTKAYPERMTRNYRSAIDVMYERERLGQKNNKGFYGYEKDAKGKLQKVSVQDSYDLLEPHVASSKKFADDEIIVRMMLPMATELSRCLSEGIVASVEEADVALIYGLGFPPFRGGVFRWLDTVGANELVEQAKALAPLGALYTPTTGMIELAQKNAQYYKTV